MLSFNFYAETKEFEAKFSATRVLFSKLYLAGCSESRTREKKWSVARIPRYFTKLFVILQELGHAFSRYILYFLFPF